MLFAAHQVLKDRDGKELKEGDKLVTVAFVVVNALELPPPDGRLTGDQKLARFKLQVKLYNATEAVDITYDEASIIKKMLGDSPHITPYIYGQLLAVLDAADSAKKG
jgi:hypothetical protein